jgi:hypothetical protein
MNTPLLDAHCASHKRASPYKPPERHSSLLQEVVLRSWWVIIIAILSFGLYEQASRTLEKDISFLHAEIATLKSQIIDKEVIQRELLREVASQNDPAWIELTLIRCLGLIPNGYTKIYLVSEHEGTDQ